MSELAKTCLCLGAFLVFAGIAVPVVAFSPVNSRPVVVVFPPWTGSSEAAHTVWDAGGYVLDMTPTSVVALGTEANFFTELRERGAILIMDAQNLRTICVGAEVSANSFDLENDKLG